MNQIYYFTFILKVVGLENWAMSVPDLHTSSDMGRVYPPSSVFRFAVAVLVYSSLYLTQVIFFFTFCFMVLLFYSQNLSEHTIFGFRDLIQMVCGYHLSSVIRFILCC
jgi:hypothetical protein